MDVRVIGAGMRLLPVVWLTPSCDNSDPTVQTVSVQIEFDRPFSPGPVIQTLRITPAQQAAFGQ